MTFLNEKINNIIRKNTEGVQIVPFLTELLNIGKESAYRRLRNEVFYTMDEVYVLSVKLNFSIDEIFKEVNSNDIDGLFTSSDNANILPEDDYIEMMKSYIKVFDIIEDNDKSAKSFYTGNRIPNSTILDYPLLNKLRYIEWIHKSDKLPINSKFSDIIIPTKVHDINIKYIELNKKLNKTIMIFDENIISAIINTIKFYFKRNLLSESELIDMREELLLLTKDLGEMLQTGKNKYGKECFIYLSDLNIESNTMLLQSNKRTSIFWTSAGKRPMILNDSKLYNEQKRWINSFLNFSVLITCSNELLQAEFVNKQYKLIKYQFSNLLSNTYLNSTVINKNHNNLI